MANLRACYTWENTTTKVSRMETKSFLSATLKLGWQRRQEVQQLTPCALCPASGEWTLSPISVTNIPCQSLLTLSGSACGEHQPPAFCSAFFFFPPIAARGLLVT